MLALLYEHLLPGSPFVVFSEFMEVCIFVSLEYCYIFTFLHFFDFLLLLLFEGSCFWIIYLFIFILYFFDSSLY